MGILTSYSYSYHKNEQYLRDVTDDFNVNLFKKTPLSYGPYTRWWWPGNDVTKEELRREVRLFTKNGFAGVEIQPLTVGLNSDGERKNYVYSWDTPAYYSNLEAVMQEAIHTGLSVDLNSGSGWPLGGSFLKPDESLLTLDIVDTTVNGGVVIDIPVPALKSDHSHLQRNGLFIYNKIDLSYAHLQTITASKIIKEVNGKVYFDPNRSVVLNDQIKNGRLLWKVPLGGPWKILVIYAVPNGEKPLYIATKKTSYVTDHFNANAVRKSYEYLFGDRTGLNKYYSKPFRAVFTDSKEFIASRHISYDFIDSFSKKRGYDIRPFLAANAINDYDNAYSFGRDTITRFVYSSEDWRLRYDYNLTITELYKDSFLNTSRNWMEKHGLQFRSQEYGIRGDVIGASGLVSIPETEQLSGNGSDGFVKLVTSGAQLYNRPLISQESFVFSHRAGMNTPLKIKAFANKAFAAGVNQLVYHGTPYKYQTPEYGKEGWLTWSTPFKPFNYSSNFNEADNYWKYIKEINNFISRSQYVLRKGKTKVDVLVYFPFIDFESSQIINNPHESLLNGFFDHEPVARGSGGSYKANPTLIQKWFQDFWPMINLLEAKGITWAYVNDESLLLAKLKGNDIEIRGNHYQGIIVANVPYMPLPVAKQLNELSGKGGKMLMFGAVPDKQPGYLDYKQKDMEVKAYVDKILKGSNVSHFTDLEQIKANRIFHQDNIKYDEEYVFLKQVKRVLNDGSSIHFLWNSTNKPQRIFLSSAKKYTYWLNPESGRIIQNSGLKSSYILQPYCSIFFMASVKKIVLDNLLDTVVNPFEFKKQIDITNWNIKAGTQVRLNTPLFDWKDDEQYKYLSNIGTYTSSFIINPEQGKKYVLDLGNVYYAAEVYINNKPVGTKIWPPYKFDITASLKNKVNTIKVEVTPANRNYFVGEGVKGNPHYSNFKKLGNTLLSAGMYGPVSINVTKL